MHSWSSPAHPYSYVSQKPRAIQSRIPTRNIASKAIFASGCPHNSGDPGPVCHPYTTCLRGSNRQQTCQVVPQTPVTIAMGDSGRVVLPVPEETLHRRKIPIRKLAGSWPQ